MKGNYLFRLAPPWKAKLELLWWIDNIERASNPVNRDPPHKCIQSDVSLIGWGAVCSGGGGGVTTRGRWSNEESILHINVFELQAALFALQSLCNNDNDVHIQISLDNTTAVAYINSKGEGSKSPRCNRIAKQIWLWAIGLNICLSATHLPGAQNVTGDDKSRNFNDNTEWIQMYFNLSQHILSCLALIYLLIYLKRWVVALGVVSRINYMHCQAARGYKAITGCGEAERPNSC